MMYWTRTGSIIISKGGLDGSNVTDLVAGVEACGIQIDFTARRLYWAEYGSYIIQSSNLDGSDVITIHELPERPFGIALLGDRMYWGYWKGSTAIQSSSTEPGSDTRVEHTGNAFTRLFTVPLWNPPRNRTNHCESIICVGVCVLTPDAYRCLY